MVALPLKLTRPRKSRNQPLAFKTLRNFNNCLRSGRFVRALTGGVSRFRVGSSRQRDLVRAFRLRRNAALFQLCFVLEKNGSVAEALLGRIIAKD